MEALQVEGKLYPVLVAKSDITEDFKNVCPGISYKVHKRNGSTFSTFPFWHFEELIRLFGEPKQEYGQRILDQLRQQRKQIEAIRTGDHPLIERAPSYFYQHQKICWALAVVSRTFNFFLEPGLGKTAIMIELMRMPSRRVPTLVVCPVTLCRGTWMRELKMRAPELTVANLHEKPQLAQDNYDVYILNPQKLVRRIEEFKARLLPKIGRVITDESSMYKNPDSKITKIATRILCTIPERYNLSGTPAPNGIHEYWGQLSFVRPGLLPVNSQQYLNTWFTSPYRGRWKPKSGAMEEIMERISTCSIFMSKEECLDLPDKHHIERYVELPGKIRRNYELMKNQLQQELVQAKNADNKEQKLGMIFARIMKLREITSGFVVTSTKDQQTGKRKSQWNYVSDHKFEALHELLQEIGPKQVVVWMNFVKDFEVWYAYYQKKYPNLYAKKCGYIYGEIKAKGYRQDIIDDFFDGKLQYLFANPASLGHGITLCNSAHPCTNAIYYDLDYSLEKFQQSQDRLHRIGQTGDKVNYYAILSEDSIDEEIWDRLKNKASMSADALGYLK